MHSIQFTKTGCILDHVQLLNCTAGCVAALDLVVNHADSSRRTLNLLLIRHEFLGDCFLLYGMSLADFTRTSCRSTGHESATCSMCNAKACEAFTLSLMESRDQESLDQALVHAHNKFTDTTHNFCHR